jgi:hypothetical protein
MLHHLKPRLQRLLRVPLLLLLPLLLLPAALSVSGCTTTSGTTTATALQTFDALYSNAVTADDLVVKSATTALQTGLITAAQAQKVLNITDSVKAALDAANAAAQLGNTALASGNLASALGPIGILSSCLTIKPLTAATFDTCTTKLTSPVVTQ